MSVLSLALARCALPRPFCRCGWVLLACASAGCDDDPRRPSSPPADPASPALPPAAERKRLVVPTRRDAGPLERPLPPREPTPSRGSFGRALPKHSLAQSGERLGAVVFDGLVEVGPAGPAAATPHGVVLFDSSDRLHVAPWARGSVAKRAEPSPLTPLAGPAQFQLARGPAVRDGVAYWVAHGKLLRAPIEAGSGPAQTLAEDARVGTRAAVPVGPDSWVGRLPEMVAYIARTGEPSAPLQARLWLAPETTGATPAGSMALSPERGVANSVALLARANGLLAVSLEARTGMSLVHARPMRLPVNRGAVPSSVGGPGRASPAAQLQAAPSEVVWVGGPSRSSTELLAFPVGPSPGVALVALERDIRRFGLAWIALSRRRAGRSIPARWLPYANGIEPAPFASAVVCGRPVLVAARPVTAAPGSVQEVAWLSVGEPDAPAADAPQVQLARARRVVSISLYAGERDGLLVYTADRKTWARSFRCVSS